jgi:hypothetical protein
MTDFNNLLRHTDRNLGGGGVVAGLEVLGTLIAQEQSIYDICALYATMNQQLPPPIDQNMIVSSIIQRETVT